MNKEKWCVVPGTHGRYEISSFGRLRSMINRNNPKIMYTKIRPSVYVNSSYKYVNIPRMMLKVFKNVDVSGHDVVYKNGNRNNALLSNLDVKSEMNILTKEQYQWLAGIIDAEGSIQLWKGTYFSNTENRHKTKRKIMVRIKTCDDIIVPTASKLLNLKYTTKNVPGGVWDYRIVV